MKRRRQLSELGMFLTAKFPTCVQQINHPIHNGQPNPYHGKFFFVGSIPAACYDHERQRSKYYDTEREAIEAAIAAGAERIQNVKCEFVKGAP